jgi:hypothetical protein
MCTQLSAPSVIARSLGKAAGVGLEVQLAAIHGNLFVRGGQNENLAGGVK